MADIKMKNNLYNKGFTIIEVLIAVALLATGLLALGTLAITNMKAIEVSKRQTQAINITTEKIEMLKAIPFNQLGLSHDTTLTGTIAEKDGNSIWRTCLPPVLDAEDYVGTPFILCTPVDTLAAGGNPVEIRFGSDNIVFYWDYRVIYIDFDDDDSLYKNDDDDPNISIEIDKGDIKKVLVQVSWKDIYGNHDIELASYRGRAL